MCHAITERHFPINGEVPFCNLLRISGLEATLPRPLEDDVAWDACAVDLLDVGSE